MFTNVAPTRSLASRLQLEAAESSDGEEQSDNGESLFIHFVYFKLNENNHVKQDIFKVVGSVWRTQCSLLAGNNEQEMYLFVNVMTIFKVRTLMR